MAFSADGNLLASGSNDKTIRLWDTRTHEQLKEIPLGSIVYGVSFSPDGTRLAAGCRDNTVRLIDVASRQQVAELRGHTDYVHAVGWSPDGTRLVSSSGDFMVRVWNSLSAQERAKRAAEKPTPRAVGRRTSGIGGFTVAARGQAEALSRLGSSRASLPADAP